MKLKGDLKGGAAIAVLVVGVSLCMMVTAWSPWLNVAGFVIALGAVVYLKLRPAQKMPGFERTMKGGMES